MKGRVGLALAMAAAWALLPATAAEEEARKESPKKGFLDEYNVDVFYAGKDVARVAGGFMFGDVLRSGLYWSRGPRLSLLQAPSPEGERNGFALGGVLVVGHRPERWVSPYASLSVDRPFGIGGRYGLEATLGLGARLRVSPKLPEHYAISFGVIRNELFGSGSVRDRTDHGVSVSYATTVLLGP